MKRAIRCLIGMFWYGFAGITVLAAVVLTLARLLLPLAEDYRAEAEQGLSDYAGQPVRVASLKAEWNGFEPQLRFSDVRLYDKQGDKILFQFSDAKMGIDIIASIKNQDLVPSSFTISGIELSITRRADKSFAVAGLSAAAGNGSSDYSNLVLKWLLRQPDIGIERSTITWTDIPLKKNKIVFKHVDLRLKNDVDTHQLTGHVALPENLGKEINIALEMQGDINDISAWQGQLYVKADSLFLPSWWSEPLTDGVVLAKGYSNIELWGNWQDKKLQSIEGKLSLADLAFSGERASKINLESLSTQILWRQTKEEWILHLSRFLPATKQGAWPESELSLRYNKVMQRFAAVSGYMQLSDVLPVVDAFQLLDSENTTALTSIRPHAVLRNTSILLSYQDNQWHADGRFSDLRLHALDTIPGVKGLSGSFVVNNKQGSLQIDSNKVVLDTAGLFREPVDLLKLTGSMQWQKDSSGWMIDAADFDLINKDITLRASMTLQIPNKGSPVIDLLANFKNADASSARKYLPARLLEPETTAWLDKSIIKGKAPTGKVLLHGPLDKFPFDKGEGKFEVRFDVIDGTLDYEPGWPPISEMQGEVIFSGRSMDIVGKTGRILDANIHEVKAHIEDIELDDPLLEMHGHVDAKTSDLIKYVVASNLAENYSEELQKLSGTGDAAIHLEINIPTSSGNGNVTGDAILKNVSIGRTGDKLKLEKINGKVLVSNEGLQGENITGQLFNKPVSIKLSHDDDASTALSIKLIGKFDLNKLIQDEFNKDIPTISVGVAEWLADLSFRDSTSSNHSVVLELSSELSGVSINMPAPFAKEVDAIEAIKAVSFFKEDGDIQLEIDYGEEVSTIVALKKQGDTFEFDGVSIAFGDELPVPPENKKVSITGQLDALSFDEWMSYSQNFTDSDDKSNTDGSLAWLEEMNIEVAALTAMGSTYNVKKLRLAREDESWHTFIEADRVKGEIHIPYDLSTQPVKANLEFLKVVRLEEETSDTSIDPRELPRLALSVDKLTFDDVELGTLNMVVSKTPSGLRMDKLAIVNPDLRFTADGEWQVEDDEQITRLNSKLKAEKFSKLLSDLGYSVGFEAGKSRNAAQIEWNGSPLQFEVQKLNGALQIRIDQGQLLDISPGAGRIFGLLSLQALPRRLTLDFSDLFKKGFSFDRIKGNFQLDHGDAYTTDLYLDGPAARIDVSGRTGLAARDYDQLITVTPDLTGGLPLAGALVGGPLAGGLVFALDKLFRPAIDDITRYQYTVTGSWDDPQVVKLEEETPTEKEIEEP